MTQVLYDSDARMEVLTGKKVAVIGYGSQGHAQALNLRDSGVEVIVSELPGTPNHDLAVEHGFQPIPAARAAEEADLIHILLPDEVQSRVYRESIAPALKKGKAISFSHGFNIHFSQIVPPRDVDVYMVAPKGPGHLVRETFESGSGVPCLIAVYQDASGKARELALAHACGIGRASCRERVYGLV